jgi:hypothetical protein
VTKSEEQKAKLDVGEKIREIARLHELLNELRSRPVQVEYKEKRVVVEVEKGGRLGDSAEKLFDMYKRNNDAMAKRLAQDMLYYYSLFRKYYKLSMQRRKAFAELRREGDDQPEAGGDRRDLRRVGVHAGTHRELAIRDLHPLGRPGHAAQDVASIHLGTPSWFSSATWTTSRAVTTT